MAIVAARADITFDAENSNCGRTSKARDGALQIGPGPAPYCLGHGAQRVELAIVVSPKGECRTVRCHWIEVLDARQASFG